MQITFLLAMPQKMEKSYWLFSMQHLWINEKWWKLCVRRKKKIKCQKWTCAIFFLLWKISQSLKILRNLFKIDIKNLIKNIKAYGNKKLSIRIIKIFKRCFRLYYSI